MPDRRIFALRTIRDIIENIENTLSTMSGPITYGTYTPTITMVSNLSAATASSTKWIRIGNEVIVSGRFTVDPVLISVATSLGISLPIASDLGAIEDCTGTAFGADIASIGAAIVADTTNNRAHAAWISITLTNQPMSFIFMYRII